MGIFNDETTSTTGSGSIGQQGPQGPPGVGFILTDNGDYNLQDKKLVNVKQGADPNDVVTKSQIQLLDNAPGDVRANKAVIYSNTGSVHTNSIYLQDIPDGAGSSNDVRLMTEHQSYQNIHLYIPDLQNFDGHGGRAKSEIMVTSTEQHITGRKTFFDINVLKPDNDDQAANKKYVDDSVKKIPSPDLSGYLEKDGSSPMTDNLNMNNNKIINLAAGTQETDAVNKYYVDHNFLNRLNPAAMGGDLDMRGHEIKFLKLSNDPSAAARVAELNLKADKNYVDNRDTYVINAISTSVNTAFNTTLRRDGTNSMTADLNLDDHKLINVKEPTNDKDGVNKKYFEDKLAESHLVSSHKTNEFKYLYDTDESASEYNIKVNGFENNFRESAHQNKKAYSITMTKDSGSNDYRSAISFNIYPLPIGTFTMIFEYYFPESTNVSLFTVGTTVYIHKQVYRAFDTYGKLLVQINNNSKNTPDRITLQIHGTAVVQNPEGYLVIYGIKGWSDSVDPRVYDGLKNEMFDFENNKMKMQVDINMNNNRIVNLADPTDDNDAVTKKWIKQLSSEIYVSGKISVRNGFFQNVTGDNLNFTNEVTIEKIHLYSPTINTNSSITFNLAGATNFVSRFNFRFITTVNINRKFDSINSIQLRLSSGLGIGDVKFTIKYSSLNIH